MRWLWCREAPFLRGTGRAARNHATTHARSHACASRSSHQDDFLCGLRLLSPPPAPFGTPHHNQPPRRDRNRGGLLCARYAFVFSQKHRSWCGLGEFPKRHTDQSTERAPPRRPAARALAPSRPPRGSVRVTRPKARRRSTRALVVVVLGVGGLVVAVGLDKDRVTGERTGERALTLARSPPREVVPERAGTSPAGSHSTWA